MIRFSPASALRFLAAVFLSLAVIPAGAAGAKPDGADYFTRYAGSWKGSGPVRTDKLPAPVNVNCKLTGMRQSASRFELSGPCTAMLFMTREIAAKLTYDRKTGRYTGVYLGAASGPAKLAGRREGNTLRLKVTWGRKVFDDNVATMLISNGGNGAFTLKVIDKINGKDTMVSDLSFRQSGTN